MGPIMVFDCESVGLHGPTFWVGWVILEDLGSGWKEVSNGEACCDPHDHLGKDTWLDEGYRWVKENVLPNMPRPTHDFLIEMRDAFWHQWIKVKERKGMLAAEVPWPVETNFLSDCIMDRPERNWYGPYPLLDIASVRFGKGFDPIAQIDRLSDELPVHSPIADARQSARLLIESRGSK